MATATLTKVGNSMAVLLPKALRQEAAIDQDTPLTSQGCGSHYLHARRRRG